jgi:D-amino-acid dehydrogenase
VEFAGIDAPPDENRAKLLVRHVQAMFPDIRAEQVRYWMGFRPSTPDSLPVLGPAPNHAGLFFAFGHGHFGITGGPPSARLVSRLVTGQAGTLDPALYSPLRFSA